MRVAGEARALARRLAGDGLAGRLGRGAFWSVGGGVVAQGLSFLATLAAARLVGGPVLFGRFALVQATTLAAANVAAAGLGVAALKLVAENRAADPARAARLVAACRAAGAVCAVVGALALLLLAPVLAEGLLKAPELAAPLRLCAVHVFFFALAANQSAALAGFEAFAKLGLAAAAQGATTLAATLVLAPRFDVAGCAAALGIGAAGGWAAGALLLAAECRRRGAATTFRFGRREMRAALGIAAPSAANGLVAGGLGWLTSVALARAPGGFVQLALYNAALPLRNWTLFVPNLVARAASPIVCAARAERGPRGFRRALGGAVAANVAAAAAIGAALWVAAPLVLRLFGKEYAGATTIAALLLGAALAEALGGALYIGLLARGWLWAEFAIATARGALFLGAAVCLVGPLGANGLALANLGAFAVAALGYAVVCRRAARGE